MARRKEAESKQYPLKHVSIRVPWHDTGWDGRVCARPRLNGACLKLLNIAEKRDDAAEDALAGKSYQDLTQSQLPPCVAERGGFMAPFEYVRIANHPYNHGPETPHGHFKDTRLRYPEYSAAAIPFAWMLRENMAAHAENLALDVHEEREPELGFKGSKTWVQELQNQKALSDAFVAHLRPEKSLCFFYAKHVPFVEDAGGQRILVGVGRVLHLGESQEYDYTVSALDGKLRSMLWERMEGMTMQTQCSCGEAEPHIVAKRQTADGIGVRLWSDGMVTGSLGGRLPGIPAGRPRTTEGLRVALRAGWELMGWVSLYDTAEIGDLYAECRKAAQAGVSLVDWRRSSAEAPSTTLRPTWEVYQADRDGRPKVRVWRLPRILFGTGLAVWDHCTGGRGGRYELVSVKRVLGGDDIAETTGLRFATLAALEAHLRSP